MILSDYDIEFRVKRGDLVIAPYNPSQVQPASYDFRLGDEWCAFLPRHNNRTLDLAKAEDDLLTEVFAAPVIYLRPGDFVLGRTQEEFKFPADVGGKVWTRSSLGRLGIRVASDAGWVDPGFWGNLVLEIRNDGPAPIALRAGMRVGQITFWQTANPSSKPYSGSYSGQFDFHVDQWKRSLEKAAAETLIAASN